MELRCGYKQSEVGAIPDEWTAGPLKGRIKIQHGFPFESRYFGTHGSYRLTTPGHFFEEGGFREIGEKQKFYDGPIPKGYVLSPGDLIVAMTEQADGLLGSSALIPAKDGYLHNQRLGKIGALTPEIDLGFLFYIFNSVSFRSKVRETAAGTKVRHTSPEKLLDIAVPLPSRAEQRAIAGALRDVDALIGALDKLIAKKRDLKQAAMQQLLTGETRLPGFKDAWARKQLSDLGEWKGGATPSMSNPDFWSGGSIPWASSSDLKTSLLEKTEKLITSIAIEESSTTLLEAAAVLIVTRSGILRRYLPVARNVAPVAINQDIKALVPDESVLSDFLLHMLIYCGPKILATCLKAGTTVESIEYRWLKRFSIGLPAPPEQTAIATVLSDMDAEIAALEARRDKTRALKQGMMQELLTGRTRLV